jgi:hypothetical protein
MRFTGRHENDGWHSLEIMSLQHYGRIFDAAYKRIPWLGRLLVRIKLGHHTARGLTSEADPGEWKEVEEVTHRTLALAKLPLNTPVPMAQLAWRRGWHVLMRETRDPPVDPRSHRPLLLGHYIQFLLTITQFWCPIRLGRLLTERDL